MSRLAAPLLFAAISLLGSAARANPVVRFTTPVGSFDVELCNQLSTRCLGVAPNTVANFLALVDAGAYHDSIAHRAIGTTDAGGVVQGGSYTADHVQFPLDYVAANGTIVNEFNQSNVRGTMAVPLASKNPPTPGVDATCDTEPDSGSSGWFVSVSDNAALDCGKFTVFGVVTSPDGMTVVEAIDALFRLDLGVGGLQTVPVTSDYQCVPVNQQCTGNPVPYLVYTEIARVPEAGVAQQALAAVGALFVLARRRAR